MDHYQYGFTLTPRAIKLNNLFDGPSIILPGLELLPDSKGQKLTPLTGMLLAPLVVGGFSVKLGCQGGPCRFVRILDINLDTKII